MENTTEKCLDALNKINAIILEVSELLPVRKSEIKTVKEGTIKHSNPEKILKRVQGIIKGYNADNSARKFESLSKFFDALRSKK